MMGRPKMYHTPEAKLEARRQARRKYAESEHGRAKTAAYRSTDAYAEVMSKGYARYRQTDKYRAAQARYRESEKAKATMRAYFAEAKRIWPGRVKARAAIAGALRRKDLVRPDRCDDCGRETRPDAHHYLGYARQNWLTVAWLCRVCHKAAHA